MVTAKVNLYVDGEFDKTVEINPGKFIPDVTPEAPEGKYFTGWYTDAECKVAMPAEGIDAVAGETKDLYAGFETYKTVKYYVGDEVVNTVSNLKVGDTHVVDYEPTAIEGMIFKGWYTEEAFTNVATSIAIAGDVNLYAKFVDEITVKYYAGNKVVKSKVVEEGQSYTFENFMLDAGDIPAGYYFTGWFSDSACTQPVRTTDLTKTITITGSVARYAGFCCSLVIAPTTLTPISNFLLSMPLLSGLWSTDSLRFI
jgi:uncharacterized repeat protein (TIGR02543 family)